MRHPSYTASIIEASFSKGIDVNILYNALIGQGFSVEEIALGLDYFLEKSSQESKRLEELKVKL